MKALFGTALAILFTASAAWAGDGDSQELSEKARSARESALRWATTKWYRERKKLVGTCWHCKGRGKITQVIAGRRGGRRLVTCPTCDGRRLAVSPKAYRALFYEMRSPAFRAIDGIRDKLESDYKKANSGHPWPREVDSYRLKDVELVDATHGVSHVLENAEGHPVTLRWVWIEDSSGRDEWASWSAKADGPWPGEDAPQEAAEEPGGPQGTIGAYADTTPILVDDKTRAGVEGHLAAHAAHWKLLSAFRVENRLLLHVGLASKAQQKQADERVGGCAVALTRAFVNEHGGWDEVRIVWFRDMRDRFGNVEARPFRTSTFTADENAKVRWKNLNPQERLALLTWEGHDNTGWVNWPR